MNRLAVFDLDGTLVDTAPDIRAAVNRQMAQYGLADFSLPEIAAMIGDGVRVLLERAFAARGRPMQELALAACLEDPGLEGSGLTHPFPGIKTLLETLAADGWRMAVCTNKPVASARALLVKMGLAGHFKALGGGDSFPTRKPDPSHLLATMAAAGGGRAIMVGDHANDMLAARGAGIPAIFVGWGYGPAAMAAGAPIAANTTELKSLLYST